MNVILKGTSDLENIDLHRVAGGALRRVSAAPPSRRVRRAAVLVPMRSLSVSPFSFPFGSVMRVREALRLQTLPFLSCATAGGMELFPTVLERTLRSSSGVVWYASAAELDFPELSVGLSALVWPTPLCRNTSLIDFCRTESYVAQEQFLSAANATALRKLIFILRDRKSVV